MLNKNNPPRAVTPERRFSPEGEVIVATPYKLGGLWYCFRHTAEEAGTELEAACEWAEIRLEGHPYSVEIIYGVVGIMPAGLTTKEYRNQFPAEAQYASRVGIWIEPEHEEGAYRKIV